MGSLPPTTIVLVQLSTAFINMISTSASASWHCQWLVLWVKSILKRFQFSYVDGWHRWWGWEVFSHEDVWEVSSEPSHCQKQWGMLISCCTAFHNFQCYHNNVNTICSYFCTMQGISRKLCLSIHKGIIQEAKENNSRCCGCNNPFRCIIKFADGD